IQQIHPQAHRPDIDAAQPEPDRQQGARHGRRDPRQHEDDGRLLGRRRPKRSSGRHRGVARDDPDLSEKQAEDEASLIAEITMVVCDGRGGTACKKRKISDTTCCSRRLSWVGRIFSPRSVPMVVEKGRTPLSRRPKSQSCLMDRKAPPAAESVEAGGCRSTYRATSGSNQWAASMMRATPLLPQRFES